MPTLIRAGIPIAVVVPFDQYDDESLSLDEEFALREFLEQENNGTLITYPAAEVRARLELVD